MRPVLFEIGNFPVYSFGIMMLLAFVAGYQVAAKRAELYGVTREQVGDLLLWVVFAGILGARIVFIAQEWDHYSKHLNELATLRFQGLTSFGGLVAGALAAIGYAKKKGIPILALLDVLAPAFVLGHIVGRIGCLLNGCCFGVACSPTTPWGIHVEGSEGPHHPAQVYDALMNLAGFFLLLRLEKTRCLAVGQLTGLALVLHGLARFIYEFWRAGTIAEVDAGIASSTYWGNLPITEAHAFAAVVIVFGAWLFWRCRGKAAPSGAPA